MRAKAVGWIVGVLAAVGLLYGPAAAWAYCVGWDKSLPNYDPHYYSVPHKFSRSEYVVEVQVLRETWLGEDGKLKRLEPPFQNGAKKPWRFDPYLGAYYDVQVLKSFKGEAPEALRLFSENSTARFWFDAGSKQVLFVSEEKFDPPIGRGLTVDTCGNSQPLSKAAAYWAGCVDWLLHARAESRISTQVGTSERPLLGNPRYRGATVCFLAGCKQ